MTPKKQNTDNREKSIRARWSSSLETKGFTPISNIFLEYSALLGITTPEALFLIHLFSYKWTVDSPYPSLTTIALKMGVKEGAVRKYARDLERKGFIKRILRKGETSRYNLDPLIKKLEDILPYQKTSRESIKKITSPSSSFDTKEEPLLKKYKNDFPFKRMGEIISYPEEGGDAYK